MSTTTHTRVADWPERLAALVYARLQQHFAWGVNDCCTWAADAVAAVTGADPLQDLRGQWSSEREALRLVARLGGLEAAVTDRLGAPLASLTQAWRGDVLLVRVGGSPSEPVHGLAVCLGGVLGAVGAAGLQLAPMRGWQAGALGAPVAAWGVAHA